jgi:hypothetical protein
MTDESELPGTAIGVLEMARQAIEERNEKYGHADDSFATVAAFWNIILTKKRIALISSSDVALMMGAFKLVRAMDARNFDSLVDIAGYAALAWETSR